MSKNEKCGGVAGEIEVFWDEDSKVYGGD